MSSDTATIEELRRRLAEAEDTLRAIREGEVDALVIGKTEPEQVFSIGNDTEAFRSFIEVMEPGAAALDERGRVLYANSTFAEYAGNPAGGLNGARLQDILTPEAAEPILTHLAPNAPAGRVEVSLSDEQGVRYLTASTTPLQIGTIRGFALTLSDVTARVRAERAEQSERAARAIIASANEAVLVCDANGVVTHTNAAAQAVFEGDAIGRLFAEAVPLVFPGATGLMQTEDILEMAVGGTPVQGIEATATAAPRSKDFLVSAAPLQIAGEAVSGCVITMVDLSQRKDAERHQLLLMRELDHRVKNTLALVLSISSRTMHHEGTIEGYQKAFTGRIQALAATHNLLAENSWHELTVREILLSELAPYADNSSGRVVIQGLDIAIVPRAAVAFGLIIHELTTNAVKYGALSLESGKVEVSVISGAEGGEAPLVIEWRESGGPAVAPPTRSGFGQTVIARSMRYLPQGGTELSFPPTGVICTIRVPREDLR